MDFDAITFADDVDAHADLNKREDIIHHVSNNMTPDDSHVAEIETPTSKTNQRKTKLFTRQSWNYDWLTYEQGGSYVTMVWCRICKAHHNDTVAEGSKKQNQLGDLDAYIKGTANTKKDTAKCHDKSNLHFRCLQESRMKAEVPPIKHSLTKLTDKTHQKMSRLMDWAYTVAYCEQPFTVFATLINIEKKPGVSDRVAVNHCADEKLQSEFGCSTSRADMQCPPAKGNLEVLMC